MLQLHVMYMYGFTSVCSKFKGLQVQYYKEAIPFDLKVGGALKALMWLLET